METKEIKKESNNKSIIIASAAALVAIVAVSGFAFQSFAADSSTGTQAVQNGKGFGRMMGIELTDEQKAQLETKRQEMDAERQERQAAMQKAIDGGYDTWAAYVKSEFGDDAPILEQVNATNFARYKEGHSYMEQGRSIMDELGIRGEGMGFGGGKGMRGGRGGHGMGGGCPMMDDNGATATDLQ